jgi:Family of unknown function (DUF6585)
MPPELSDTSPAFGSLISVHAANRRRRLASVLGWLALCGGALACGFIGGYRWFLATTQYGPAVIGRWSTPWFLAAGGLGAMALVGALLLWRTRGREARVYRAGFTYRLRGQTIQVGWADVVRVHADAVRYGIFGLIWGGDLRLRLDLRDGRQVRLTRALDDLPDLVEKIKRNVFPHLLAGYTRAFNLGQVLSFGPVTLSASGVTHGGRMLPWSEMASAKLDRGVLKLSPISGSAHRPMKVAARQIPNFDVCLQLIQNLGHTA